MMKKIIALCLSCLLLLSAALAADYATMTDEELKAEHDAIRSELFARGYSAEAGTVLLDKGGILVYMTGDPVISQRYSHKDSLYLTVPVIIINRSSRDISHIYMGNESVNGWAVTGYFDPDDIPAGKKAKGEIRFDLSETDITEEDGFEDMEFSFTIQDNDFEDIMRNDGRIAVYAPGKEPAETAEPAETVDTVKTAEPAETVETAEPAETETKPASLEGTWKLATVKIDESLNYPEEKQQQLQQLIDDGIISFTVTFIESRVTIDIKLDKDGSTFSGSYRMENGTLYVTADDNPDSESPMTMTVNGDTMELPFVDGVVLVMTRAE